MSPRLRAMTNYSRFLSVHCALCFPQSACWEARCLWSAMRPWSASSTASKALCFLQTGVKDAIQNHLDNRNDYWISDGHRCAFRFAWSVGPSVPRNVDGGKHDSHSSEHTLSTGLSRSRPSWQGSGLLGGLRTTCQNDLTPAPHNPRNQRESRSCARRDRWTGIGPGGPGEQVGVVCRTSYLLPAGFNLGRRRI